MFDKVQESLKRSKDERQKKRLEKERLRLEKADSGSARLILTDRVHSESAGVFIRAD